MGDIDKVERLSYHHLAYQDIIVSISHGVVSYELRCLDQSWQVSCQCEINVHTTEDLLSLSLTSFSQSVQPHIYRRGPIEGS